MNIRHGLRRQQALLWSLAMASTLSLGLWIVSLGWSFGFQSPGGGVFAVSQGALALVRERDTDLADSIRSAKFYILWRPFPLIWFFRYSHHGTWWECAVPLWPIVLMAGIPAAWLWTNRPRRHPGHCRTCGYDLHGLGAFARSAASLRSLRVEPPSIARAPPSITR
jgi:hypothetical protein